MSRTALVLAAIVTGWLGADTPNVRAAGGPQDGREGGWHAAAVTEPPTRAVSLDACVTSALAVNARQAVSAESLAIADARRGQAHSARYPTVAARVSVTQFNHDLNFLFPASTLVIPGVSMDLPAMTIGLPAGSFGPGFPAADLAIPVPGGQVSVPAQAYHVPAQNVRLLDRTLVSGTVSAVYAVYTGGLVSARVAQARAGVDAARHEQRQTAAQITFDVYQAYFGLLLAERLHAVAHDSLERMEATLTMTEQMYTLGAGGVKKTDFLRHQAMVATIRAMLAAIDGQREIARAGLAMLVGWAEPGTLEIFDREFPAVREIGPPPVLVAKALDTNPQIGLVAAGVAAAHAGVRAARAGHLPSVGVFSDLRLFGNRMDDGIMTPENKRTWSVGIGVDVPLFQGFRVAHEVGEARARARQVEAQQRALRDGIAFEMERAVIALHAARSQQAAAADAYRAAGENRELTIKAYQQELVETKDVIEAQLTEALLAAQHLRGQYELAVARARVDHLLGTAAAPRS